MTEEGTETCGICKGTIIRKMDNYVKVIDYFRGKLVQTGFYHHKCYTDVLQDKKEYMKQKIKEGMALGKKMVEQIKENA